MNCEIRILRIFGAGIVRFQWHLLAHGMRRIASGECDTKTDAEQSAEAARRAWIASMLPDDTHLAGLFDGIENR